MVLVHDFDYSWIVVWLFAFYIIFRKTLPQNVDEVDGSLKQGLSESQKGKRCICNPMRQVFCILWVSAAMSILCVFCLFWGFHHKIGYHNHKQHPESAHMIRADSMLLVSFRHFSYVSNLVVCERYNRPRASNISPAGSQYRWEQLASLSLRDRKGKNMKVPCFYRIHGTGIFNHIYLHLVDLYGKYRYTYHNIPYMDPMGVIKWAKRWEYWIFPRYSTVCKV